jgi:peptide/nickel transport system substrate-binding protein
MQRWGSDYMDPHSNAEAFGYNPDNGDNARSKTLAWRNSWYPAMTEQVIAASRERDQERRAQMYLDMQREHQRTAPFAFMLQTIETAARRANVDELDIGPTADRVFYGQVGKT